MNKRKILMKKEQECQRKCLIIYLSKIIKLHFKYFENEEFETFQQYINSGICNKKYSKEGKEAIFREVDNILEKKYGLFFAHYDLDKPVYIIDVTNNEEK